MNQAEWDILKKKRARLLGSAVPVNGLWIWFTIVVKVISVIYIIYILIYISQHGGFNTMIIPIKVTIKVTIINH